MDITLIGSATCSRCKTAKMMLEHRGYKEGINFKYIELTAESGKNFEEEIPFLTIEDGDIKVAYAGKAALMRIRELRKQDNNVKVIQLKDGKDVEKLHDALFDSLGE